MMINHEPKELLKNLLNDYKMPAASLSKITGISEQIILDFANGENVQSLISQTEMMDLIDLVGLLVIGMNSTDSNERVFAITQALNNEFGIPLETISLFSNLESEDIEKFMAENESLSIEKRYNLAVTALFLHYIIK
ncbi:HTH domain-containing protein [Peribacillus muralis]|uniref:HTH domain-containing protein n=1 Tax=Peribacillus muralis TaxID=264697 RepID=UPI00070D4B6A|nr:HTH domain-containing protein [Peribacillus muralis]